MNIPHTYTLIFSFLLLACNAPEKQEVKQESSPTIEPITYELVKQSHNDTNKLNLPQEGRASFYADRFQGRPTASGEAYDSARLTAAHRTLPFGTKVKVSNLRNNKSVVVTINDRGPHHPNRIIDLSKAAARKLGFIDRGVTRVRIEKAK